MAASTRLVLLLATIHARPVSAGEWENAGVQYGPLGWPGAHEARSQVQAVDVLKSFTRRPLFL
jgi:hypothetical protein